MKIIATGLLVVAFAATLGGCRTTVQRETPVGQACHRQFSYDLHPRYYSCLFELSAPSAFYDDREIQKVLDTFTRSEGGECTVKPERDIADVRTQDMDHGLRYRLFNIECQ